MPSAILLPTAVGDHGDAWTQNGGSSKFNAVDPGDPVSHDDQTSTVFTLQKAIVQSFKLQALTTKVPSAKEVTSVEFFVRCRSLDAKPINELYYRSANASVVNITVSGIAVLAENQGHDTFSAFLPPPDNGAWTTGKADVIQVVLFVNDPFTPGRIDITSVWAVPTYGEAVTTVQSPDEVARRILRRRRFPDERYTVRLRARGLQSSPWSDFRLADKFAPSSSGQGYTAESWASLFLRATRKEIDPNKMEVTLAAFDPKRYLSTFFLQAISDAPGSRLGTVLSHPGIEETFTRATKAWIQWKDGLYYEVAVGEPKHNHLGWLIEKDRTNRLLNSAFHVDGGGGADLFASWTEQLSAAGLSADTTDPAFADLSVVKQHLKITETSPIAGRGVDQTTAHSFTASQVVTLAIIHKDESGAQARIIIQNVTTGNYLQSNGTWGASSSGFAPWASSATRVRDYIVFTMEATGSTLALGLRANAANEVVHYYHTEFNDAANYARSPIVTTTAEVTENNDEPQFTNPLGLEAIPFTGEQFTIQMVLIPHFDSDTDLNVGGSQVHSVYILNAPGAPSDSMLLYLQDGGTPGANHFAFHLGETGGVNPTFVRGDTIKIVHRRSSSRGEHDLEASKDHMMVQINNGAWIEGAQVSIVSMDPQTDCEFYFASGTTGGEAWDGVVQFWDVRPSVLTKEEAKDFP